MSNRPLQHTEQHLPMRSSRSGSKFAPNYEGQPPPPQTVLRNDGWSSSQSAILALLTKNPEERPGVDPALDTGLGGENADRMTVAANDNTSPSKILGGIPVHRFVAAPWGQGYGNPELVNNPDYHGVPTTPGEQALHVGEEQAEENFDQLAAQYAARLRKLQTLFFARREVDKRQDNIEKEMDEERSLKRKRDAQNDANEQEPKPPRP